MIDPIESIKSARPKEFVTTGTNDVITSVRRRIRRKNILSGGAIAILLLAGTVVEMSRDNRSQRRIASKSEQVVTAETHAPTDTSSFYSSHSTERETLQEFIDNRTKNGPCLNAESTVSEVRKFLEQRNILDWTVVILHTPGRLCATVSLNSSRQELEVSG